MNFIDWDPLTRSLVFGGIFLVCLIPVLWQLYETIGGNRQGRWAWLSLSAFAVLLTTPAVVVGAANLEDSKETLLNIVSWLAIAGALLTVSAISAYAMLAREPEQAELPFVPAPQPPVFPSPEPISPPTLPAPAPRRVVASNAFLFVKDGPDKGKQFPVAETVVIGRANNCTITLDDRRVSSQHAQVKEASGQYVFTDLRSTNGSFLVVAGRDEPIRSAQILVDGDEIRVGQTILEFVDTRKGRRQ